MTYFLAYYVISVNLTTFQYFKKQMVLSIYHTGKIRQMKIVAAPLPPEWIMKLERVLSDAIIRNLIEQDKPKH
jgi:hypothetical protein